MKFRVSTQLLATALLAACASNQSGSLPSGFQATSSSAARSQSTNYQYSVAALGTLGGSIAGGNSINDNDWVSGISTLASGTYLHAALWEDGTSGTDLGTLGGPNSGVEWPVKNEHGLISGISETSEPQKLGEVWSCALAFFPQPPSGHVCRGFAWENGHMTKLPTLGGNNGFAAGANDRGLIVGWAETRHRDRTCTSPQVLGFEAVVYNPSGRKKIV
jgi:probable HAF family extracellular repeat protein